MKQRENKSKLEVKNLHTQEERADQRNGHPGSNPPVEDATEGSASGKLDWLTEALPASDEMYRRVFETSDQGDAAVVEACSKLFKEKGFTI